MARVVVARPSITKVRAPLVAAGAFILAFAARILALLRGGGLRGYGSYDDTVYLASALGWVHGRWPYRDFLLIQPPGIVVTLAPFAALSRWLGDSGALAVSRLAWMLLGSLTAAGLVALLWRTSRVAAVVAGLFYAFFWPAIIVERVTYLEGAQNFLLMVALLLLRPFGPPRESDRARRLAALAAGMALGLAWSIKIWYLAPIVVLAGWMALGPRRRDLGWFGLGVIGSVSAVCLPFFIVAPQQMWSMVVTDQLSRPWHAGWPKRLVDITGTDQLLSTHRVGVGLTLVLIGLAITVALALRRSQARLFVVMYLVIFAVLVKSPPTYVHYGGFVAPSMAILIGVATSEAAQLTGRLRPQAVRSVAQGILAAGVVAILATLAHAPATARMGHRVPAGRIAALTAAHPGCISYDEPSPALSLNLVSRDLDRGCPFVVDLGELSHWTHMRANRHARPTPAESIALHYLRSGSASLLYRYPPGPHGRDPVNIVGGWTLLAQDHGLRLVEPLPGRSNT